MGFPNKLDPSILEIKTKLIKHRMELRALIAHQQSGTICFTRMSIWLLTFLIKSSEIQFRALVRSN